MGSPVMPMASQNFNIDDFIPQGQPLQPFTLPTVGRGNPWDYNPSPFPTGGDYFAQGSNPFPGVGDMASVAGDTAIRGLLGFNDITGGAAGGLGEILRYGQPSGLAKEDSMRAGVGVPAAYQHATDTAGYDALPPNLQAIQERSHSAGQAMNQWGTGMGGAGAIGASGFRELMSGIAGLSAGEPFFAQDVKPGDEGRGFSADQFGATLGTVWDRLTNSGPISGSVNAPGPSAPNTMMNILTALGLNR